MDSKAVFSVGIHRDDGTDNLFQYELLQGEYDRFTNWLNGGRAYVLDSLILEHCMFKEGAIELKIGSFSRPVVHFILTMQSQDRNNIISALND